jgi:ATP-dependent Clp protease ATP-binding subunit ClpB
VIPELEAQLPRHKDRETTASNDDSLSAAAGLSMLHDRVTSSDIARVVAKATGIPVQSLLKGEREKLAHVRLLLLRFVLVIQH